MSQSRSGKLDPDLEGVELLFHQKGGSASFGTKMALPLNGVDPGCESPITGSTCRAKCSNILHDRLYSKHYTKGPSSSSYEFEELKIRLMGVVYPHLENTRILIENPVAVKAGQKNDLSLAPIDFIISQFDKLLYYHIRLV